VSSTRWSALIGLLGLGISAYLTATHYLADQVPLACASGGLINCEQVTTSSQSQVGPLPVAVLGLLWFGIWLGLLGVRWLRMGDAWPRVATLSWATGGVLVVFYLVYAELFLIGAVCLWCSAVHLLVMALFVLAVADTAAGMPA
jgi:uncharacterized membrane protein